MSVPTAVLRTALEQVLGPVTDLARRPSPSASTAALEELSVALAHGVPRELVLKTCGRRTAHELAVYRDVLAGAELGTPALVTGSADDGWLVLERLDGAPLWQSASRGAWCATARWLARAHAQLASSGPGLPPVTGAPDVHQLERAAVRDPRVRLLAGVHAEARAALAAAAPTVVHGELFPSNVLLAAEGPRVVDWETAGCGAGLLDLAALCAGWDEDDAAAIAAAYGGDLGLLPAARLVVAVRWLGEPPAPPGAGGGHAGRTDWWSEALSAAAAHS